MAFVIFSIMAAVAAELFLGLVYFNYKRGKSWYSIIRRGVFTHDPDTGYYYTRSNRVSDPTPPLPDAALAPPGFPPRKELARRYAERTGRDLSKLDFYVGFNRWKTAAIIHGVYARYMEGKKSTEGVDLEGLRQMIDRSLTASTEAVARLGA